jgi:hypothetical protein
VYTYSHLEMPKKRRTRRKRRRNKKEEEEEEEGGGGSLKMAEDTWHLHFFTSIGWGWTRNMCTPLIRASGYGTLSVLFPIDSLSNFARGW